MKNAKFETRKDFITNQGICLLSPVDDVVEESGSSSGSVWVLHKNSGSQWNEQPLLRGSGLSQWCGMAPDPGEVSGTRGGPTYLVDKRLQWFDGVPLV